jgi:hypothetical protein
MLPNQCFKNLSDLHEFLKQFSGVESMNLVSEISNELAIAILVEKRHHESLQQLSPKELIEKISLTLEDRGVRVASREENDDQHPVTAAAIHPR